MNGLTDRHSKNQNTLRMQTMLMITHNVFVLLTFIQSQINFKETLKRCLIDSLIIRNPMKILFYYLLKKYNANLHILAIHIFELKTRSDFPWDLDIQFAQKLTIEFGKRKRPYC